MPHHLTKEERDRIAQLYWSQHNRSEIARALGRSPSTISRELRRNGSDEAYHAAAAQAQAERRRKDRPLKRKMDFRPLNEAVRSGVTRCMAPAQIAGRLQIEFKTDSRFHISRQTIYRWIERDPDCRHWRSFLRHRGKRRWRRRKNAASKAQRCQMPDRPQVINQRRRLGDYEGDTVLGQLGTGGLITIVDRKSRYTMIEKVKTKTADRVYRKIRRRLSALARNKRHSITFDNGTEFTLCDRLECHLGLTVYSSQPGRPHQRGTNENTNGLLRQFFPKGIDFRSVTHHQVREAEESLNHRPRACLGFQTPHEVFNQQFTKLFCI
jgi:IS30 family transposase